MDVYAAFDSIADNLLDTLSDVDAIDDLDFIDDLNEQDFIPTSTTSVPAPSALPTFIPSDKCAPRHRP